MDSWRNSEAQRLDAERYRAFILETLLVTQSKAAYMTIDLSRQRFDEMSFVTSVV